MQAVILAAGTSNRLKPLTNDIPKCLLPIEGQTLLSRYLNLLEKTGVKKTIIVCGFNQEAVRLEASLHKGRMNVKCIINTEYKNTHPADSFILTENQINDDFLLLNSDIYFSKDALQAVVDKPQSCVAIDSDAPYIEKEMFVNYDAEGRITEISKLIHEKSEGQGKSIQIAKFLHDDKKILFDRAKMLAKAKKIFYPTEAYDVLIEQKHLYIVDIAGDFSHELDTIEDYNSLTSKLIKINK